MEIIKLINSIDKDFQTVAFISDNIAALKTINALDVELFVSGISDIKEFEFYFMNHVSLMQGNLFDNVISAENLIEKICNVY